MPRSFDRADDTMRPIVFEMDPIDYAEGSCIVSYGKTKVLCTASLEESVPKWLQNSGKGWITAEYSMLPRSTHSRIKREKALTGGRSQEISRLVARALRSCADLSLIKENSLIVDCDVIQADGGTRTAAITGGFVALARAFEFMLDQKRIEENPLLFQVAGLSAGFLNKKLLIDLDYEEDSSCDADINLVMTSNSEIIEIQGTAEGQAFSQEDLANLIEKTSSQFKNIFQKQKQALGLEVLLA